MKYSYHSRKDAIVNCLLLYDCGEAKLNPTNFLIISKYSFVSHKTIKILRRLLLEKYSKNAI